MTIRRYLRIAGLALLLSLCVGLLSAGQLALASMGSHRGYTFGHALIMQTPFWLFWVPVFPVILWLVDRYPLERGTLRRNLPSHLAAGLGFTILHYGFQLWFMHVIGHGFPRDHSFWRHFVTSGGSVVVHGGGYLVLLGLALARDFYRKYRERQLMAAQLAAQLSQARLHALRMQLNPHFLFNALNSIAMLTRRNENTSAVRMLAGLGDLLRHVLEGSPADEVPLRDEVAFLMRYLEIEKVRFADRLTVRADVAEEVAGAYIPNLLLQPIVENAVRHGIARKTTPGRIEIAARRLGDRLVLQVSDDGPGVTMGPRSGGGLGLANTRSRLEQLYDDQFSCELRNGDTGGAVVTISLPFHTQPASLGVSVA